MKRIGVVVLALSFISSQGLYAQGEGQRSSGVVPIVGASSGRSNGGAPVWLMSGVPGRYSIVDESAIRTSEINWSIVAQEQDRKFYLENLAATKKAFDELYGTCADEFTKAADCTGFRKLVQIHIDTVSGPKATSKAFTTVDELSAAIADYNERKTKFLQAVAAIAVTEDVFKGTSGGDNNKAPTPREFQYRAGAANLKAFADTYKSAVDNLDSKASDLTYRVNVGSGVFKITNAGDGLTTPKVIYNRQQIQAEYDAKRQALALTPEDKVKITQVSVDIGRQLVQYFHTNNKRLFWYTKGQTDSGKAFVASIGNKMRTLQWLRGGLCVKLGVPALDIQAPRNLNIQMLYRGLDERNFRVANFAETDEGNIRDMLSRFEIFFLSLRSQAGDFNNAGGLMGFINRANSVLTWTNETRAAVSMMYLLHQNMLDELDLITDARLGCQKVQQRYLERHKTFKDGFFESYISPVLQGTMLGAGDSTADAFAEAGPILLGLADAKASMDEFIAQNPGSDRLSGLIKRLNLK